MIHSLQNWKIKISNSKDSGQNIITCLVGWRVKCIFSNISPKQQWYTVMDWVQGQQQFWFTKVHQGSPRTDLLLEAASWGQHIHSPVKQNCCCPRSQFIIGLHLHFFQNYIFYLLFKKCFHSHLLSKNLKDSYIFYFDIVMSKWCDLLNQWK